jgi:hypothetical protein
MNKCILNVLGRPQYIAPLTPLASSHSVEKIDFPKQSVKFVARLNKLIDDSKSSGTKTKSALPVRIFIRTNKVRECKAKASKKVLAGRKALAPSKELLSAGLEIIVKDIQDQYECSKHDGYCFQPKLQPTVHYVLVYSFICKWAKQIVSA